MRLRRKKNGAAEAAVLMSPLIDCVFLLLIFFLVTSQLKRWERQIPVTLADPTASVAREVKADAYLLGLNREGRLFRQAGRNDIGLIQFAPVEDVQALMDELLSTRGPDAPIELVIEQQTPFQTVIDILDVLQLQGLTQVRSRIRDGKL